MEKEKEREIEVSGGRGQGGGERADEGGLDVCGTHQGNVGAVAEVPSLLTTAYCLLSSTSVHHLQATASSIIRALQRQRLRDALHTCAALQEDNDFEKNRIMLLRSFFLTWHLKHRVV